MRLTSLAAATVLLLAGCTPYLGERPPAMKRSGSQGPRDRYETAVLASDLGGSAAYEAWVAAGRRALRASAPISGSGEAIIRFPEDEPVAVAYRLDLRRGQRLRARIDRRSMDGELFVELFEQIGNRDPIFRLVESAAPRSQEITFEAHTDGVHVLRLQPELLRGGEIAITLTTAAGLTFPVLGVTARAIGSYFGDARDGGRREHEGIDIFASRGTDVLAVADGVITDVGNTRVGGRVVWQYDSERQVHYYYAHLDGQHVRRGQRVQAGSVIGTVGNTGNARTTRPHLHFGVYRSGRVAIDPMPFIHESLLGMQ